MLYISKCQVTILIIKSLTKCQSAVKSSASMFVFLNLCTRFINIKNRQAQCNCGQCFNHQDCKLLVPFFFSFRDPDFCLEHIDRNSGHNQKKPTFLGSCLRSRPKAMINIHPINFPVFLSFFFLFQRLTRVKTKHSRVYLS